MEGEIIDNLCTIIDFIFDFYQMYISYFSDCFRSNPSYSATRKSEVISDRV